jgi:hypothetical protein
MSYIFDIDEVAVWSPALRVGELYVSMAWDVAGVLDISTGMTAMAFDYWEIELSEFESFVRVMY